MADDWFSQNAPSAPAAQSDWFASNAPQRDNYRSVLSPQEGAVSRFASNLGQTLKGAAVGVGQMLNNPFEAGDQISQANRDAVQYVNDRERAAGYNPDFVKSATSFRQNGNVRPAYAVERMIAEIPVLGPFATQYAQKLEQGDVAGTLGGAAGFAIAANAPKMLGDAVPPIAAAIGRIRANASTPKPTIEFTPDAAAKVTDAVNPNPKIMGRYQQNIQTYAPDIAGAAREAGFRISSRAELSQAAKLAGDQVRGFYYDQLLNPVKDQTISVPPNYAGEFTDPVGRTATLGQIDTRLARINSILNPAFEKGGGAASRTALSAQDAASLNAEAGTLRTMLYATMGQKLGLDPQVVAGVRAKFGALGDIAEKTQLSTNNARYAQNVEAAKPAELSKMGVRYAQAATRSVLGEHPDNVIRRVFSQYEPDSPDAPQPNPPSVVFNTRTPTYGELGKGDVQLNTPLGSTPAEIAQNIQRLKMNQEARAPRSVNEPPSGPSKAPRVPIWKQLHR